MKTLANTVIGLLITVSLLTAQETRTLEDFDEVSAATGIDVILVESNETKVEIEVQNCEPEEVITKVSGDRLQIKFENNNFWSGSKNRKATVTVHYRELESIDVSSGASISARNIIQSDELEIDGSSGGRLSLEVRAGEMEVDASSGGVLDLEGRAEVLEIDVSSGGVINAYDLIAGSVEADASSGGSLTITAEKSFNGSASSGGSIKYKGDPERVKVDASISGSIRSRD